MTRSEQLGIPRWLRVRADGTISGRCLSDTRTGAQAALPCTGTEYVVSAASHAIGHAKPLPSDRCVSCGIRRRKSGYERCDACRNTQRQAIAAQRPSRVGEKKRHAPRTPAPKATAAGKKPCRRDGYWQEYFADPVRRARRNEVKRDQRARAKGRLAARLD